MPVGRPEVSTQQPFDRRRPGGCILTLDDYPHRGQPIMLTEFGGIAYKAETADSSETWGYPVALDEEELTRKFTALVDVVTSTALFSGYCYKMQLGHTYAPANQPFVYIEPMTAPVNALCTGHGLHTVASGKQFDATFCIVVDDVGGAKRWAACFTEKAARGTRCRPAMSVNADRHEPRQVNHPLAAAIALSRLQNLGGSFHTRALHKQLGE